MKYSSSSSSCYCSYWLWPLGEEEIRRIPHESTHQRGTRIFLRIGFSWYRCYNCHSICSVSKLMVLLILIVQRTKTKKRQRKMKKQRKELSTTPREAEKEPFDDSWYIWCNNRFSWLLCSEIVLGRYQVTNKHDSFVLLWSLDQSLMGALQRNSFQTNSNQLNGSRTDLAGKAGHQAIIALYFSTPTTRRLGTYRILRCRGNWKLKHYIITHTQASSLGKLQINLSRLDF